MSTTQRGQDDSKEMVYCAYCADFKTRKDNLRRHTEKQHPGLQPNWKRIVNQKTKLTDFFTKTRIGVDENENLNSEEIQDIEEPDEPDEPDLPNVDVNTSIAGTSQKRTVDDDGDRANIKRLKNTSECPEDVDQVTGSYTLEEVRDVGLQTLDKVTLIQNMLENLTKDKVKNVQQPNDTEDDITTQIEVFKTNLNHCIDLESTEEFLQNNGYTNFPEKGFFACKLCFGDSEPAVQPAPKTPGIIQYDRLEIVSETRMNPQKQSRALLNLKKTLRRHVEETKSHKEKLEEKMMTKIKESEKRLRTHEVGLNIFRLRYYQIQHGLSYLSFEEMILTAQLNKTDIGDVNHSRKMATKIDKNLTEVMKDDFKRALETKLEGTGQLRPLGFAMDKMTPNKQTGQVHAMITPVPENPLSEDFIVAVMMPVPVVTEGDAVGLAKMSKSIFNEAGAGDHQLEGVGWDGQYVKMGVLGKLLEIMEKNNNMDDKQMKEWITQRWEPAHNIELATKDVKDDVGVFDWFNTHIKVVNEATEVLKTGKGLQQTIEASEALSLKLYKLQSLSSTRFPAYFESSLSNFDKSIEIIIRALKVRAESKEKKVKDIAAVLLKKIVNKHFLAVHLGLIDVYRVLGSYSSMLQKVEQFPWDVTEKLTSLVKELRSMGKLKLTVSDIEETITLKRRSGQS